MSDSVSYCDAKEILGDRIIGIDEITRMSPLEMNPFPKSDLRLSFDIPDDSLVVPFSKRELEEKKQDYLLILGCSHFNDGLDVTIRSLRNIFGLTPYQSEPCFYNQDWYENESFIDAPMSDGWFFIRERVFEASRAVMPSELVKSYTFPSAVTCTYSFFLVWLTMGIVLWPHDFVWCNDRDHNGDCIYVGRYYDSQGINKNGFNIHRHLSITKFFGSI